MLGFLSLIFLLIWCFSILPLVYSFFFFPQYFSIFLAICVVSLILGVYFGQKTPPAIKPKSKEELERIAKKKKGE